MLYSTKKFNIDKDNVFMTLFLYITLAFLSRCARVIFIVTGNSYRISCYNKGTMCCLSVEYTKGVDILIYFKYAERHEIIKMKDNIKYYVVKQKALPEVLLKVAEANRLIENKNISIADATEKVGISRSSYYKYKDDIFPFRDNSKGKTITFVLSMEDEPGLLSVVLKKVAEFKANILTIHQTIPVNGIASLTLSVEILPTTGDASMMIEEIEQLNGVRYLKILSSDASL